MLRLLAQFPLLTSRHLYTLTPGGGQYPAFYQISRGQQRCNDRLRILYDLHCINKYSPPLGPGQGTSVQYCWLDRAGAKVLGLEAFRRRISLPHDYLHRSQVMDIYCNMVTLHRSGFLELKYAHVERQQKTWPIIPDCTFLFRVERRGYFIFVEVDRSEKKEKEEIEKIRDYRTWQTSNVWLNEEWAKLAPTPRFPRVIYAFDDARPRWQVRAKRFQEVADSCGLRFSTCTIQTLPHMIKTLAKS